MAAPLRHEYYETDEKLTITVYDKGVNPADLAIKFEPRSVTYEHGEKKLVFQPLKGEIDPAASDFAVGKVKVEIRLMKRAHFRWGGIEGESADVLNTFPTQTSTQPSETKPKQHKNWESITTDILKQEKDKTTNEDPNAGGDSAVNGFFQKLYQDADPDTQRAMLKSFQESGGTTLSTNWDEVSKAPVTVKPPEGSEWKKWG